MKNKVIYILIIFLLLSCNNDKKENIKRLNIVMNDIKLASKTTDPAFVESVISEIEIVEGFYPEQQSLKESKFMLEIRLKKYDDAISTIDSLLKLSPDDIDNRIIQGILLEVSGYKAKSMDVYGTALELIDMKIKNMIKRDDVNKKLGREVNRIMLLKLLYLDQPTDYERIKNDPEILDFPQILQLLTLMEEYPRETLLKKYR